MTFMRTVAAKLRRHWIRWLSGTIAGILGLAGVTLICATYRPGWYRPATITPADSRIIRNELPSFGSAIGTYLAQGRQFRIELTDEQINRWLAARGDIWPAMKRALPPEVREPAIAFEAGRIILGARYERNGLSSVVSLSTTLDLENAGGAIAIHLGGIHAGLLPVPRMFVEQAAKKALAKAIRSNWSHLSKYTGFGHFNLADQLGITPKQVTGYLAGRAMTETRLPSHWVWPNGRFPFYVSNVQIQPGKMLIDIVPVPRAIALSDAVRHPGM